MTIKIHQWNKNPGIQLLASTVNNNLKIHQYSMWKCIMPSSGQNRLKTSLSNLRISKHKLELMVKIIYFYLTTLPDSNQNTFVFYYILIPALWHTVQREVHYAPSIHFIFTTLKWIEPRDPVSFMADGRFNSTRVSAAQD